MLLPHTFWCTREPSGRTQRYGFDFSVRYQLSKLLYADVDLTAANPRSLDAERGKNYLPIAPTFTTTRDHL